MADGHSADVARAMQVWQVASDAASPDAMLRAARWIRELRLEAERDDRRMRAWAARQPGAATAGDADAAARRTAAIAAYQAEVLAGRIGGPDEMPGDVAALAALARTVAAMAPRGIVDDAAIDALAADPEALREALLAAAGQG